MGVRDFGLEVTDSGVPAHTSELACVHFHSRGPRPPTNQPTNHPDFYLSTSPPLTTAHCHSLSHSCGRGRQNQSINQSIAALRCVALHCGER